MNREFLKGLGLDDAAIDKVMAEHGKTVEAHKSKTTELQSNLDDVNKQLKDRDKQLTDLSKKAKGNEELEKQIEDLKAENEKTSNEFNEKIKQQTFDFALERALTEAKAKNPKAVKALLDKEAIKLDGEKLLGLDEQLKTLAESDGYLFEEKEDNTPRGAKPAEGNPPSKPSASIGVNFAQQLNEKGTSGSDNNPWAN